LFRGLTKGLTFTTASGGPVSPAAKKNATQVRMVTELSTFKASLKDNALPGGMESHHWFLS
jgi:hypothetical protein